MENIKTTPVKGTRDYNPKEMQYVQFALDCVRTVYSKNGFSQIKTPILENLELLSKGDNGDNSKMMFQTVKRGAKLVLDKPNLTVSDIVEEGLRYDLTVPLTRFFAGNLNNLPLPFKAYQIGESFRAEKPQKARDREFIQCDIDIFGDHSNLAEIEIITSAMQVYSALNLESVTFKINDRRILSSVIEFSGFSKEDEPQILIEIDKADKIGFNGVKDELLKLNFDASKVEKFIQSVIQISKNGLNEVVKFGVDIEIVNSLKEIIDVVTKFAPKNYDIKFDTSIIRGQSYYTGVVFEAFYNGSSITRAIGGGGRYDKMLGKYLNKSIPAVGLGLGLVGCVLILMEKQAKINKNKKIAVLYNENSNDEKMAIKTKLMKDYEVCLMPEPKNYNALIKRLTWVGFDGLYKMNENKFIWFD